MSPKAFYLDQASVIFFDCCVLGKSRHQSVSRSVYRSDMETKKPDTLVIQNPCLSNILIPAEERHAIFRFTDTIIHKTVLYQEIIIVIVVKNGRLAGIGDG